MKGCRKAEIKPNEPDPDNAGGGKKLIVSVLFHKFKDLRI